MFGRKRRRQRAVEAAWDDAVGWAESHAAATDHHVETHPTMDGRAYVADCHRCNWTYTATVGG